MPRACVIVLDAVGAGELPDAADFGDEHSDTLGNVARAVGGLDLPNLEALGLGDRARCLTLAEEGIAVSRRSGARLWEFSALLTRIRALRETQGLQATREIEAVLVEAAAWLEMSGAKSYEPFLHIERAALARLTGDEASRERALREAHRLFTEIGATARADQVARELGA